MNKVKTIIIPLFKEEGKESYWKKNDYQVSCTLQVYIPKNMKAIRLYHTIVYKNKRFSFGKSKIENNGAKKSI